MAKGFIKRSTLEAIADAIRSKTRSTAAIFPADMAAMIEEIKTGDAGIMHGTFKGGIHTNVSLGVTLPNADNYLFACTITDAYDNAGYGKHIVAIVIANVQGVKTSYAIQPYSGSVLHGYVYGADLETNDTGLTVLSCEEFSNLSDTYEWWYFHD